MVLGPYRVVQRLFGIAGDRWAVIDGEAAFRGVNLLDLPLHRFLNAIYYWAIQRVEDAEQFHSVLYEPVAGEAVKVTAQDVKAELDDFAAFMGATST